MKKLRMLLPIGAVIGMLAVGTACVVSYRTPATTLHYQDIGVAAVRKHCYKEIGGQALAGVRVRNPSGLTGPVHLEVLTGLVLQVHSRRSTC